jgi:hypothetical protein
MTDWSAALTRAFTRHLQVSGSSGSCGSRTELLNDCNSVGGNPARTTAPQQVVAVVPAARTTAVRREPVVLAAGSQKCESNQTLTDRRTTGTTRTTGFRSDLAEVDEQAVLRWLDDHPAPSRAGRCAWCGHVETENSVVPFGTVPGTHAWLHVECWPAWQASRRAQARHALLSEASVQNP